MREEGVEAGRNRVDATRPGGWKPREGVARAAGVALWGRKPRESEVVGLRAGAKEIGSYSEAGRSLRKVNATGHTGAPPDLETTRPSKRRGGCAEPMTRQGPGIELREARQPHERRTDRQRCQGRQLDISESLWGGLRSSP